MSREGREGLGRASQPVRERWRDLWEASSTTPSLPTREGGHPPKRVPDDGSAGSSGRGDLDQAVEARAGALFSQAVLRDPFPQHKLIAIAERLRRRPIPRRAVAERLVVRLAATLSLLVVGGALAATATHYFNLPLRFGRPSPSPLPAKRSVLGKIGQASPGVGDDVADLPVGVQRPPPVIDRRDDDAAARRSVSALDGQRRPSRPSSPSLPTGPISVPPSPPSSPPSSPSSPSSSPPSSPPSQPQELEQPSRLPEPSQARQPPELPEAPTLSAPARPSPTPLAEESALIMSALTALRGHGDAIRALAILDRHDLRFPLGDLADEAALARVEALVKVKRSDEALVFLEARGPVRQGGSQRKLTLTRAELRAAAGKCAAALDELDALLRGAPPADGVTERALWGRAACRASGGHFDLARADLERYLRLFPAGQFARGARAALEGDSRGPRQPAR